MSRIPRREFLHLGATGIAASVAASASPLAAAEPDPNAAAPGSAPPPQQARQQAGGPAPEYLEGRPDPTTVVAETWVEPWTWRPNDWPGTQLDLNVVGGHTPGPSPSRGNPASSIFSYGGTSPGPTIRMRGDEALHIKLRNLLGLNRALRPVGPYPDPLDLTPSTSEEICRLGLGVSDPEAEAPRCRPLFFIEESQSVIPGRFEPSYTLSMHVNGPHSTHVTNLHTHGLHVSPSENPDGTHADDVLLRVIPKADFEARQLLDEPAQRALAANERVGEVDIKIDLGGVWRARSGGRSDPHPPGTHWYHPHPHGATNDQVASGMAGYIIVEGDVDDAINTVMTGKTRPDPGFPAGPYDYRERLVFIQRVFLGSLDFDAGPGRARLRFPPFPAVNGLHPPNVMFMRPGAVERWRVLNGSVDGKGSKRFMVLEGEYVETPGELWRVIREAPEERSSGGGGSGGGGSQAQPAVRYERVSRAEIQEAKLPLYLLARDGVTLVSVQDGDARHTIKDLSKVNAGTTSPLDGPGEAGEHEFRTWLRNIEACFRDGESLRLAFNRPNEVYLTNANRADVFFKAPTDAAGKVFTVFAQEDFLHQDNTQQGLQAAVARLAEGGQPANPGFRGIRPLDVVVGYIRVQGEPVEGGDFDVMSIVDELPPVPPYLMPVTEDELRITPSEAARVGRGRAGQLRTRVLAYSGWGAADFPLVRVPAEYAESHPELKRLTWDEWDGEYVLLPPDLRTMAIHGDFDLAARPDPGLPQKFSEGDPHRPVLLAESAEEWAVYNLSMPLWAHSDLERFPQPGAWANHRTSYALTRAEGQRRFWEDHEFMISAKGNDHPFHIHVNPCWVTRIEVPDENGVLHNILEEPTWLDTIQVPRDGGRTVFRSRFPDFTGQWVHHCHILAHEDTGMMQIVECTEDAGQVNYRPRDRAASHEAPSSEIDRLYPRASLDLAYRTNLRFEDRTHFGYTFPGFDVEVPEIEE